MGTTRFKNTRVKRSREFRAVHSACPATLKAIHWLPERFAVREHVSACHGALLNRGTRCTYNTFGLLYGTCVQAEEERRFLCICQSRILPPIHATCHTLNRAYLVALIREMVEALQQCVRDRGNRLSLQKYWWGSG